MLLCARAISAALALLLYAGLPRPAGAASASLTVAIRMSQPSTLPSDIGHPDTNKSCTSKSDCTENNFVCISGKCERSVDQSDFAAGNGISTDPNNTSNNTAAISTDTPRPFPSTKAEKKLPEPSPNTGGGGSGANSAAGPTATQKPKNKKRARGGVSPVGVVFIVLAIVVVVVLFFVWRRRRRRPMPLAPGVEGQAGEYQF